MLGQLNKIKGTPVMIGHSAIMAYAKHVLTATLDLRTVKLPWWSAP